MGFLSAGAGAAGVCERVEMIRQHLCQYTQLRHETDMFNQREFSTPGRGYGAPVGPWARGSHGLCAVVAGYIAAMEESVLRVGRDSGLWATLGSLTCVSYPGHARDSIPKCTP